MLVLVLAGCGGAPAEPAPPVPPAPAPPPAETTSPPPATAPPSAPAPSAKPADPPTGLAPGDGPKPGEPTLVPAKMKMTLSPPDVVEGGKLDIVLENVDDHEHRFWHPGGSNGCAAFRWQVSVIDEKGVRFFDHLRRPDEMCTAVMVPPSWIVVKPGERVTLPLATNAGFYVDDPADPTHAKALPKRLPAGKLTVVVTGAGIDERAPLRMMARKR